jgi:hypothetical protein
MSLVYVVAVSQCVSCIAWNTGYANDWQGKNMILQKQEIAVLKKDKDWSETEECLK